MPGGSAGQWESYVLATRKLLFKLKEDFDMKSCVMPALHVIAIVSGFATLVTLLNSAISYQGLQLVVTAAGPSSRRFRHDRCTRSFDHSAKDRLRGRGSTPFDADGPRKTVTGASPRDRNFALARNVYEGQSVNRTRDGFLNTVQREVQVTRFMVPDVRTREKGTINYTRQQTCCMKLGATSACNFHGQNKTSVRDSSKGTTNYTVMKPVSNSTPKGDSIPRVKRPVT